MRCFLRAKRQCDDFRWRIQWDPGGISQSRWFAIKYTDPREKIVAVALVQHFPFNEHNFFAQFATGYYQALR